MTRLLPFENPLRSAAHVIRWHEQGTFYTTCDGGKTLTISPHLPNDPKGLMPATFHQEIQNGGLRLVQTLFCDPHTWWNVCKDGAIPTIPLFLHKGWLIIGPAFSSNGAVCPTCAGLRLAQGFPRPDLFTSMLASQLEASADLLHGLTDMLQKQDLYTFVAQHLERFLSGELLATQGLASAQEARWHRILAPPGDHPGHYVKERIATLFGIPEGIAWKAPSLSQPETSVPVIDPLVGPLLATRMLPAERQEPCHLIGAATITGSLGAFTKWSPDANGSGCNFDAERAGLASIGEAVERYCGNALPTTLLCGAEQDLAPEHTYLSQQCFHVWTSSQVSSAHWPLAPIDQASTVPWVAATSLTVPGETVLLPAEIVYLKTAHLTGGPAHYPVNLAGIAAHRNVTAARDAAMLELIERDATMLFWHGGAQPKQLIDLPEALKEQLEEGTSASIKQWYLLLETDFPVPVVAVCLHDLVQDILVTGFAARIDLAEAVRKAAAEAWQLRRLSQLLQDPKSILWKEIDAGRLPLPTTPFRADRTYAQAFQQDFADMTQLSYSLQYYLDPSTHPYALRRLAGTALSYEQAQLRWEHEAHSVIARCLPLLKECGWRLYTVDLTTSDMQACGFVVVRVICQELVGNTAPAFIPMAHPRLQQVAELEQGQISRIPMPHA